MKDSTQHQSNETTNNDNSFIGFVKRIFGFEQNDKNFSLSPQKLAEPINNHLINRYQGLIDKEELTTVNPKQAQEIIKQLDSDENAQNIDLNGFHNNPKDQNIISLLPSSGLNTETPNSNVDFTTISVTTTVLILGMLLIFKGGHIYRYLFGESGLYEQLMEKLGMAQPKVSDTTIFLYNRTLMDAKVLAKSVQVIDNDKFSNQEFLLFAKIKFCITYNLEEYEGLTSSIEHLNSALKAQASYSRIEQIELSCQGYKQKEFYQYVQENIKNNIDTITFQEQVNQKLSEILPQIKTDEGKQNLQTYAKEISVLAQDEFSLNLFALFNQQELANFSVLKSISELISNLKEKEVINLKTLTCLVMVNYDRFEEIGDIIGMTKKQRNPDTYGKIIQYLALGYRHQHSFDKFEQLILVMRQWYQCYKALMGIRQEYPPQTYRQPKVFLEEIPGFNLYLKYKNSLSDKKISYNYIDFEEKTSIIDN
jgi:hypothetical protein